MRKLNKYSAIPAGIIGIVVFCFMLIALIGSVQEIRRAIEIANRFAYDKVKFPWREVSEAAFGVLAIGGISVGLLAGKKSGWLSFALWVYVFAQTAGLFAMITAEEVNSIKAIQTAIGIVLFVLMALECGAGLKMPIPVKCILLIVGMAVVEFVSYLQSGEMNLPSICANLFAILTATAIAGGDPREEEYEYEEAVDG